MHFKSNPLLNQASLNVNRETGVIHNISIVEEGVNKNKSHFGKKYLDDLANGANEIKAGVKSRFGHPNMCGTTLGSYIGRYKDFQFDGKKVTADLHLDEITKKTQVEGKGISMFDYLMSMASSNPDVFGNSIHIPEPTFEDEAFEFKGQKFQSHIFNGIVASDIVDSPAATSGLFDTNDLGIVMTNFLDENPQVFEVVQKNPAIIEDFFERYSQYSTKFKTKIDMGFLDGLKKKFGVSKTFDINETLADGSIITVTTENETIQKGDSVAKDDGTPLEDGEHLIKDGETTITVVSGVIDSVTESGSDDADGDDGDDGDDADPTPAEMMSAINGVKEMFGTFQTQYAKDLKESQEGIQFVADTFENKFSALAKTVKSATPPEYTPEVPKKDTFSEGYDPDAAKEARQKIEESKKNKK